MRKRILKRWGNHPPEGSWLLLHQEGDYEYRRPDSVYVHRWVTFRDVEEATGYLDNNIPKVERDEWRLYQLVADGVAG